MEPIRIRERITMTVPEGACTGTKLLYNAPDGQELRLTVPEGVGPGSVMTLEQDPTSKVWRCMADPVKSTEEEVSEITMLKEHNNESFLPPPTYVEPSLRVYASGGDTPRVANMPPATPVMEHHTMARPVKLSRVSVVTDSRSGHSMQVPSYTPPPQIAGHERASSFTPVPSVPSYTPPVVLVEQRPSYTPPPVVLVEQRPSFTPLPHTQVVLEQRPSFVPPQMVATPAMRAAPAAVLTQRPGEVIQLGASYIVPSATPPRVMTVNVTHHRPANEPQSARGVPQPAATPHPGPPPGAWPVPSGCMSPGGSVQLPPGIGGSMAVSSCATSRGSPGPSVTAGPEVQLPAPPVPTAVGPAPVGSNLPPFVQPHIIPPPLVGQMRATLSQAQLPVHPPAGMRAGHPMMGGAPSFVLS